MPNKDRPINLSLIRFQYNWLLTANGWVFEPIWWDNRDSTPCRTKTAPQSPPPKKTGGEGWLLPLYP